MNNNEHDNDNIKYNTNMYSGFEEYNQTIGITTQLDENLFLKMK